MSIPTWKPIPSSQYQAPTQDQILPSESYRILSARLQTLLIRRRSSTTSSKPALAFGFIFIQSTFHQVCCLRVGRELPSSPSSDNRHEDPQSSGPFRPRQRTLILSSHGIFNYKKRFPSVSAKRPAEVTLCASYLDWHHGASSFFVIFFHSSLSLGFHHKIQDEAEHILDSRRCSCGDLSGSAYQVFCSTGSTAGV